MLVERMKRQIDVDDASTASSTATFSSTDDNSSEWDIEEDLSYDSSSESSKDEGEDISLYENGKSTIRHRLDYLSQGLEDLVKNAERSNKKLKKTIIIPDHDVTKLKKFFMDICESIYNIQCGAVNIEKGFDLAIPDETKINLYGNPTSNRRNSFNWFDSDGHHEDISRPLSPLKYFGRHFENVETDDLLDRNPDKAVELVKKRKKCNNGKEIRGKAKRARLSFNCSVGDSHPSNGNSSQRTNEILHDRNQSKDTLIIQPNGVKRTIIPNLIIIIGFIFSFFISCQIHDFSQMIVCCLVWLIFAPLIYCLNKKFSRVEITFFK